MTSPADTIREARVIRILIDIVRGRKTDGFNLFTISGDELNALAAALTELEQQLAAAKVREDRLALGVVTKSNELARAEAAEAELRDANAAIDDLLAEKAELEADRDLHKSERDKNREWAERALADRDRLAAVFASALHVPPDGIGPEGMTAHRYEPGHPMGCPICAALDRQERPEEAADGELFHNEEETAEDVAARAALDRHTKDNA